MLFVAFVCSTDRLMAQRDDPFGGPTHKPKPAEKPSVEAVPTIRGMKDDALRKSLSTRGSIAFNELPLGDAVESLSQQFGVRILVDDRSLEEIGLSANEPVSLSVRNISLRSILNLMLGRLDLTYRIHDEVLTIVTVATAESNLTVRAYRLPEVLNQDHDELADTIHTVVVPDTWDLLGGPSTLSFVDDVLVVMTTDEIHEKLIDVMNKIVNAEEVTP